MKSTIGFHGKTSDGNTSTTEHFYRTTKPRGQTDETSAGSAKGSVKRSAKGSAKGYCKGSGKGSGKVSAIEPDQAKVGPSL